MKITVLLGGPSDERPVSLVSGAAVAAGLRAMGHEVLESDIAPDNLAALDQPADVIFPVLHGQFGEDGQLQQILEQRNLPFVGSGSQASRIAMDKVATKEAWQRAGLPTAPWEIVSRQAPTPTHTKAPCVVKPIASGSSIDIEICQTDGQVHRACEKLLKKYESVLVEKFVKGIELTVGILQQQPLPPIRITTSREFYDYQAKYQGGTEYHFDLNIPDEVARQAQELGVRAHEVLGCRDLSRVDMIVDAQMQPWLLEINTLPGFTPRSLLPKAAGRIGVDFNQLVDRLARSALDRHLAGAACS